MRLVPSAVEGNPQPNAPSSRGSSVSADSRACVPQTTSDVLRSIQGERTASGGPARSLALVVNLHALRWIFGNADAKKNHPCSGGCSSSTQQCPSIRPERRLAQDKIPLHEILEAWGVGIFRGIENM